MQDGLAKTPLRKILYQYVPKHLIEREKQGFAIPKAEWLRNELREWAEGLLSEEALAKSNCFYPSLIRRKWSAHLNTEHDYSFHLWPILMFQSWYREYME
jgi:asparagine synthase (glutamine-hydrolysing)